MKRVSPVNAWQRKTQVIGLASDGNFNVAYLDGLVTCGLVPQHIRYTTCRVSRCLHGQDVVLVRQRKRVAISDGVVRVLCSSVGTQEDGGPQPFPQLFVAADKISVHVREQNALQSEAVVGQFLQVQVRVTAHQWAGCVSRGCPCVYMLSQSGHTATALWNHGVCKFAFLVIVGTWCCNAH
jgi:hypothetical protein